MQQKTARKEAWRPKCAARRLVYDSALFKTFMHVYVRTMYDQTYSAKRRKNPPPEVRFRDGHVEHVCKKSGSIS